MSTPSLASLATTPSLLRRLAAMIYDSLIVVALILAYGAIALAVEVNLLGHAPAEGERARLSSWWLVGVPMVVAAFNVWFWHRAGQTVGMRAWRLQVVPEHSTTLEQPTLKQATIRYAVSLISLFAAGLGYLWALVDKHGKTLHDHASHTHVVLLPKAKK